MVGKWRMGRSRKIFKMKKEGEKMEYMAGADFHIEISSCLSVHSFVTICSPTVLLLVVDGLDWIELPHNVTITIS